MVNEPSVFELLRFNCNYKQTRELKGDMQPAREEETSKTGIDTNTEKHHSSEKEDKVTVILSETRLTVMQLWGQDTLSGEVTFKIISSSSSSCKGIYSKRNGFTPKGLGLKGCKQEVTKAVSFLKKWE